MGFWIIAIALAALVSAVLGITLLRGRAGDAPPAAYDLEVYRDQLKEVERDLARGVLSEDEAKRLRTEVSRRVLAADAQLRDGADTGGQPRSAGVLLAAVTGLLLIGGAVLLYQRVGAPGYPDMPLKARIAASDAERSARLSQAEAETRFPAATQPGEPAPDFAALMVKLREAVAAKPDDLHGQMLLARNEASLGNIRAAQAAQARVIALKGDEVTAGDHAFYADLLITAAGGYVSSEAEAALRSALELEPQDYTARYYLGVYFMQVDRPDAAFRLWEKLLNDSPPGAPWVAPIRSQLPEMAARAGVKYQLPPLADAPGPDAADVEAAEGMDDAERQEMIAGMVTRLSERLANEGGTAEEWARLIGAYGVLGNVAKAREIWAESRQVFKGRTSDLELLDSAAINAGVTE